MVISYLIISKFSCCSISFDSLSHSSYLSGCSFSFHSNHVPELFQLCINFFFQQTCLFCTIPNSFTPDLIQSGNFFNLLQLFHFIYFHLLFQNPLTRFTPISYLTIGTRPYLVKYVICSNIFLLYTSTLCTHTYVRLPFFVHFFPIIIVMG